MNLLQTMNYWHMQLHPNNKTWVKEKELLKERTLIGLGNWEESKNQQLQFETLMAIGDVVVIRNGKQPIAIVEITGDYRYDNNTDDLVWFQRQRKIKVLDYYKSNYNFSIPKVMGTLTRCSNLEARTSKIIIQWYNKIINQQKMEKYLTLLKSNKNLVLTGAPGTGKTYLAKKIAEKIVVNKINEFFDFDEIDIKEYIKEKEIVKTIENYSFSIISITNNNIKIKPNNAKNEYSVPRKDIIECLKTECYNKSVTESNKSGVGSYMIGIAKRIITRIIERYISFVQFHPSYDYTDFVEGLRPKKEKGSKELGFELKNGIFKEFCKKAKDQPEKDFVFIIDEINRAEISKVFGELFFAIDSGYRGEEGKVKTQYANMQTNETFFTDKDDDYFFVPENVYIMATMNDIDRSVESFDFAMRRRFAWIEIKVEDRVTMLDEELKEFPEWIKVAKDKMENLNIAIFDNNKNKGIEGLNSSYHIGPAYFLKLLNYKKEEDPWGKLWENHLEVLLREYLRGMPKAEDKLEELKDAYDLKKS